MRRENYFRWTYSYPGRSRTNCHSLGNIKTLITFSKKGAKLRNSSKVRTLQCSEIFLKATSLSEFDPCLSQSFAHPGQAAIRATGDGPSWLQKRRNLRKKKKTRCLASMQDPKNNRRKFRSQTSDNMDR